MDEQYQDETAVYGCRGCAARLRSLEGDGWCARCREHSPEVAAREDEPVLARLQRRGPA